MSPITKVPSEILASEMAYVSASPNVFVRFWRSIRSAWRCSRIAGRVFGRGVQRSIEVLGGASTLALASVRGRGSFRGVMMKRLFLVGLVLLLACSSDPKRMIELEPSSGGAGGSSGSAGSGGSSEAGNGGTTSAGSGGSSQAGSAGSTSDGGTPGYTSGSRLRAKYLVGTDGSRSFQGWYDSLRQEDCFIGYKTSDGKDRCLPIFGVGVVLASTHRFSDNLCTQPLFRDAVSDECQAPTAKYGYLSETTACNTVHHRIFSLTAVAAPSTVYIQSGDSCTATTPTGAYNYYMGVEIPPSEFQEMTMETE